MPFTVLAYHRRDEDPRVIVGTRPTESAARQATRTYFLRYPEDIRHVTRITLLPLTEDGDIPDDAHETEIDANGHNVK